MFLFVFKSALPSPAVKASNSGTTGSSAKPRNSPLWSWAAVSQALNELASILLARDFFPLLWKNLFKAGSWTGAQSLVQGGRRGVSDWGRFAGPRQRGRLSTERCLGQDCPINCPPVQSGKIRGCSLNMLASATH